MTPHLAVNSLYSNKQSQDAAMPCILVITVFVVSRTPSNLNLVMVADPPDEGVYVKAPAQYAFNAARLAVSICDEGIPNSCVSVSFPKVYDSVL